MRHPTNLRSAIGGFFAMLAAGLLAEPWYPTLATVCVAITAVLATALVLFVVFDELRKRRYRHTVIATCRFGCTEPHDEWKECL